MGIGRLAYLLCVVINIFFLAAASSGLKRCAQIAVL
jgi:hypothetical protein